MPLSRPPYEYRPEKANSLDRLKRIAPDLGTTAVLFAAYSVVMSANAVKSTANFGIGTTKAIGKGLARGVISIVEHDYADSDTPMHFEDIE